MGVIIRITKYKGEKHMENNIINMEARKNQWEKEDEELSKKHDKEFEEFYKGEVTWEGFAELMRNQLDETIRKSHHINKRLIETGFASADPKKRKKEGLIMRK